MSGRGDRTAALLEAAAARAIRYRRELSDRRVAPTPEAAAAAARLDEPLPDAGTPPEETLALIDEVGSAASMAMAGPRFFGFVIGGTLPVSLATHWLAAAWDQNVGMHRVTPALAVAEQVALDWLVDLFGLPAGTGGNFVTGATMANFSALAAARRRVCLDAGWDVDADGLRGAPEITVLVGAEAHPTVTKALGLLGLGRDRVRRIPVDGQGRMRAGALPAIDGPTIVCTQVGNLNTGACDPVADISAAVRPAGAWVHVDGAFGLWAAAAPARRHLLPGVGGADSWATDAHKWLNVPYDCGVALVRRGADLKGAMAITADYLLTESEHRNPSDFTPELSRRARGLDVWAALRTLGRQGVAELVEQCCRHARRFAEGFAAAGHEILNEVELNQVLVDFGGAERTVRVVEAIQADGTCWCGTTVWQGRTAMRISVSSWETTAADVERSLETMLRLARETR